MQEFGRAVFRLFGEMGGLDGVLGSVQSKMMGVGKAAGVGLAAVAGGLAAAGSAALSFESSFAGIKKTVDLSDEGFAQLEQNIRNLASSTDSYVSGLPNATESLNKIGELAGQLGVTGVDNLTEFIETIGMLGMTTNLSMEEGSMALAQFANIVGMPMDQIDNLGATIVDLGNNLATTEADIVHFAQRIAGAGAVVDMSEADIMALAAAMSSLGINAEAGGTAISRVLVELDKAVAGTGDSAEETERLGQEIGLLTDKIGIEESALQRHNEELALQIGYWGESDNRVKKHREQIDKLTLALEKDRLKLSDLQKELGEAGAGGKLEQFAALAGMTSEEFKKAWGEDPASALNQFVKGLGKVEAEGGNVFEVLEDLEFGDIRVRDSLLRMAGASDLVTNSLTLARAAWQENTALTEEARKRWETGASQIELFKNKIRDLAIGVGKNLLPAVGALVGRLAELVDKVAPKVIEVVQRIATWFMELPEPAQNIIAALGAVGAAVGGMSAAAALAGPIVGVLGGSLAAIAGPIGLVVLAVGALATAWFTNFGGIQEKTAAVFEAVKGAIQSVIDWARPIVESFATAVSGWFTENWPKIVDVAETVWGAVRDIIKAVVGAIQGFVQEEMGVIVSWVQDNWPLIQETVTTVMEAIRGVIEDVVTWIEDFWKTHGEAILATVSAVWEGIKLVLTTTWDDVKIIVDTALRTILDIIKAVMLAINGDWEQAWEVLKGAGDRILQAVLDVIANKIELLLGIFTEIGPKIGEAWGLAWESLPETVTGVWESIVDALKTALSTVTEHRDEWLAGLEEIAAGIISGLAEGIKSRVTSLVNAILGTLADVINKAKEALGISSPSTVFMGIGASMIEGLQVGMQTAAARGIGATVEDIMGEFKRVFEMLVGIYWGWHPDDIKRAQTVTSMLAGLAQMLSTTIDAFRKLTVHHDFGVLGENTQAIVSELFETVHAIAMYARTIMADDITKASGLVGIYSGLAQVFSTWLNLSNLLAQTPLASVEVIGQYMTTLKEHLDVIIQAVMELAGLYDLGAVTLTATFVGAVKGILEVIKTALEAIAALGAFEFVTGMPDRVRLMVWDLVPVLDAMIAVVEEWGGRIPLTTDTVMGSVKGIFEAIKGIVGGLAALAEYAAGKAVIPIAGFMADLKVVVAAIEEYGRGQDVDALEAAGDVMAEVGRVVGPISTAVGALGSLAEFSGVKGLSGLVQKFITDLRTVVKDIAKFGAEFVAEDLKPAGDVMGEVARIVSPIKAGVDALAALAEFVGVKDIAAKAEALAQQLSVAVTKLLTASMTFKSIDTWKRAGDFAAAITPAVALIAAGVQAINSLADLKWVHDVGTKAERLAEQISTAVTHLLTSSMTFKAIETWQRAGDFATAISAAVGIISTSVQAINSLAEFKEIRDVGGITKRLANQIATAVSNLLTASMMYEAIETWERAGKFAQAIGPAVGFIKGAVDGLMALADYSRIENFGAKLRVFMEDLKRVLDRMVRLSQEFAPKIIEAAGAMAEEISKVAKAVTEALGMIDKLADFGTEYITPEKIDVLADIIWYVVETVAWLSYQVAPVFVDAAAAFAEQMGKVFEGMKTALDFLGQLGESVMPDEAAIRAFLDALKRVLAGLEDGVGTSAAMVANAAAIAYNLALVGRLTGIDGVGLPNPEGGGPEVQPPFIPPGITPINRVLLPQPRQHLPWDIPARPKPPGGGGGGGGGGGTNPEGEGNNLADRTFKVLVQSRNIQMDILDALLLMGSDLGMGPDFAERVNRMVGKSARRKNAFFGGRRLF